jgi:hypothetical protein
MDAKGSACLLLVFVHLSQEADNRGLACLLLSLMSTSVLQRVRHLKKRALTDPSYTLLHRKSAILHGHRPRDCTRAPNSRKFPCYAIEKNLTKSLYPRTCRTVTLLATLAGRPHTDVSGLRSTLAGSGAQNRDPLMQGERLLPFQLEVPMSTMWIRRCTYIHSLYHDCLLFPYREVESG